ncbi:type II methionyl aminopeptidase [Candidatus Woesearchaeota archaeon CG10_big_fil_rev_8_21_14_0_10_45_16]|nr:MAG: type II methionyl aminopeptidase [Candidatus Woesearchaeota archaeon CG10_big_fil_rev_8_21_14_0_10_45_16]
MDEETLKKCIKAGKIAAQVRREGAEKLAKPGTSFLEVMDHCEKRILQLGGQIAWAQMALNDVAAHFCPEEDDAQVSREGDLIKIDIGVHQEGYIADNAMTVQVKTKEHSELIKAAQNALRSAVKLVEPGRQLWELGEAQYSEAEALGFTTVKNLSGHTLEQYKVHAGVSIPAFNTKEKTQLKAGWQIAIEPFVTPGQGLIKEKGKATIFMVHKQGGARTPYARKILDEVKSQNGLPFTTRWLTRKFGKGPTALGLRELERTGILHSYPPLAEVSSGLVSQFEHSMIVSEKTKVYTRHEDDTW